MSDTLFRIVQAAVGVIFIFLAIFAHRLSDRAPILKRHKVDRILMFIGGLILLLYGVLGRLPYLF